MRHYKAEVDLHFVWATQGRQPLLTEEIEQRVFTCIKAEAARAGYIVLVLGAVPDHVHLAVQMPTTGSISHLMKQVKGASSALVNDLQTHQQFFRWQEGYGVFSISRPHLPKVIDYVTNQKKRHATNKLWKDWEPIDVLLPTNMPR